MDMPFAEKLLMNMKNIVNSDLTMIALAAIHTTTLVLAVISKSIMMARRQTTELHTERKRYEIHNTSVDAIT